MIDRIRLKVKAGDGGKGLVAFRRAKYVPLGGPDGGDGGNGGSVWFVVDTNETTLSKLRYTKSVQAGNGAPGLSKKMHGKSGEDLFVKVPLGTLVRRHDNGDLLADLTTPGQKACIAKGGNGGKGNWHFATGRNDAPEFAGPGETGERVEIDIELRLLADAGLIGFPSVGKSTFLSVISSAKPQIAAYPFTTLEPNIGVVTLKDKRSFVCGDMPGLIEGAGDGKGLGHEFLRHIQRCRVLIHVIDMSGEFRDPISDYKIIRQELEKYDSSLLEKQEIVVANKMDVESSKERLTKFMEAYPKLKVYPVSTLQHEGLDAVLYATMDQIEAVRKKEAEEALEKKEETVVYRYQPKKPDFVIESLGPHRWKVVSEKTDRLAKAVDFEKEEETYAFAMTLKKMGVDQALIQAGVEDGDQVIVGTYIMNYHS